MIRLLVLGLGAFAVLTIVGCTEEEAPPPPPIRPVLSLVVEPRNDASAGFTGTIEPRYSTDLGFRVLGRMIARDVDVGDAVEAGAVLARLDPMVLDLSVRSLEAELSNAEAQLANAAATEERQQALVDRNAGTPAAFEQAQEAREAASAAATRGRASLAKAREQLSYTRLVSDTDGIVTATGAEVGQTVTAGQTVVTVARANVREAVVDIPDEIARGISPGDGFDVTLQIDPSAASTGTVREVAPEADAATRTRRVRITLDAPPPSFRLGTTVNAAPRLQALSSIDVPRSALVEDAGEAFVWVVTEAQSQGSGEGSGEDAGEDMSTVSRRAIAIAGETGNAIRIESGIEVGTRIVTAGVNSLTEGQQVRINQDIAP